MSVESTSIYSQELACGAMFSSVRVAHGRFVGLGVVALDVMPKHFRKDIRKQAAANVGLL